MKSIVKIFTCFFISMLFLSPLFNSNAYALSQFGSPADLVIGQEGFELCNNGLNRIPNNKSFSQPIGLPKVYDGKLIIPTGNDSRVLIYNSIPTLNYPSPDIALGTPNPCIVNALNSSGNEYMMRPMNVHFYGNNFLVTDYWAHRVLIYTNGIPETNLAHADLVIGQPDFYSYEINQGGTPNANTLNSPWGVWSNGSKLIISEESNNRVLIWNTFPTVNNTPADIVIGQPDMTSNTTNNGGISAKSLKTPRGIHVDSTTGKLFISDYGNHRVLVFNSIPATDFKSADYVIGQPNLTSNTSNNGGRNANRLSSPTETYTYNGKLFIGDRGNNRVLIFNSIPLADNASADFVIGQNDMISGSSNQGGSVAANTLSTPHGAFVYDGKVIIPDRGNNRILIYNSIPGANNASADVVLGQPSMTTSASHTSPNSTYPPASSSLARPNNTFYDGQKLYIADYINNRVLIYNSLPTTNNASADVVIGQPNMNSNTLNNGGISDKSLCYPRDVYAYKNKLYIADYGNNRILIFNSIPETNFASANIVIGQPTMTVNTSNNGGISAKSLSYPSNITIDTTTDKLFITDYFNNRILIYNSTPIINFKNADLVIGQPAFNTNIANNGGIGANTLNRPLGVDIYDGYLVITDGLNNRILIYNQIPTSINEGADTVIGQPDFFSNACNQNLNHPTSFSLCYPADVALSDNRLYISDGNYRVLIFNKFPFDNFPEADLVIGQDSFKNCLPYLGIKGLQSPRGIVVYSDMLFISEEGNNRVLLFTLGPKNTSAAPESKVAVHAGEVVNTVLNLVLAADDAKDYMISEDPNFIGANWTPFTTNVSFQLSSPDVTTVYIKFRDFTETEGEVIILDISELPLTGYNIHDYLLGGFTLSLSLAFILFLKVYRKLTV